MLPRKRKIVPHWKYDSGEEFAPISTKLSIIVFSYRHKKGILLSERRRRWIGSDSLLFTFYDANFLLLSMKDEKYLFVLSLNLQLLFIPNWIKVFLSLLLYVILDFFIIMSLFLWIWFVFASFLLLEMFNYDLIKYWKVLISIKYIYFVKTMISWCTKTTLILFYFFIKLIFKQNSIHSITILLYIYIWIVYYFYNRVIL